METEEEVSGEVFTVTQDYKAESSESITVHRGEKVLLVTTVGKDPAKHVRFDFEDVDLGVEVEGLLDNSGARHKMAVRPRRTHLKRSLPLSQDDESRWKVRSLEDPTREGWAPIVVLAPQEESPERLTKQEVGFRREAVISELIETEEEFCRDLMQVVDRYLRPLDGNSVPRYVSDKKDLLFGNLKEIAIFHNTVLLEGIKYYATEAKALGRTFLRMERDFDKHVAYCHDEPIAQDFLQENDKVRDFFDDLGARLHDDKTLSEHLKLPIQRINDYQLLLKELVKYSDRLGEDTTDLNKALELMLGIPHRADDLKFITNIEGYHGDIHKLGRLLRHNWFRVKGKDGKTHERYLFLFKARILVCKVRKISEDRYVFVLKEIIRLPEVEVKDHRNDPKSFQVGPLTLTSHQEHIKEPWLAEIRHYARNALTLAEHQADDLRLREEENKNLEPLKGVELDINSGQLSSDEEMDKSTRRTSLSRRVEEMRSSVTESVTISTVVMETEIDMSSRCVTDVSLFSKTIEGLNVPPGGIAVFECEVEAESVIWLKDNKPISDRLADRVTKMSIGNTHRLEILNVSESDAGVYTAHASTTQGQVSTCTANLVVQKLSDKKDKMPSFLVRLKDTELLVNTYLRFMVKVKGDPNPTVEFFKDGVLVTYENEHMTIISDKQEVGYYELCIPEVQKSDAGVYTCKATNIYGEADCQGIVTITEKVHTPSPEPEPEPEPPRSISPETKKIELPVNIKALKKEDKKVFEDMPEQPAGQEPVFSWIKNGQPFDPEERFKVLFQEDEDSLALVFTHVKPEDAGLYTCVASTSSGKISCSAELTVQGNVNLLFREPEVPKIIACHKIVEANTGSSTMLETKVTGYPKPDVKWFKEGQEIEISDRYRVLYEDEETISLVIKNITMDDVGDYKAVSTNCAGQAEDIVSLVIKSPPSFVQRLNDITKKAGEELKLTVQVEASPRPEVTWCKDGKELKESERIKILEEGKSYSLLIEECNLFDVGSYSVTCKNEIAQSSEFCKVEVHGAPVFTRTLVKKVDTEEGDSLTFLVKVYGNPMPSVKWFFKGENINSNDRCKFSNDADTYTLTINSIKREDAGDYSCQLTNPYGTSVDHGSVFVRCSPKFTKPMGNVIAQEGDTNVGFSVNVESHPRGKIRWFHNETEITETMTEYSFKEEESTYGLVVRQVTREAYGKYKCRIENQFGSDESSAELTVLCKPVFKKELKNVTVNEGDTLTLQVEINSTPEPEIKWYKDGQEVTGDAHIKIKRDSQRIETYELTVDLVKAEDGGEYEVRATNEMGSEITKSTVIVQTSPQITKSFMADSEVFETWESTFEVEAIGIPRPVAKWFKDDTEIEASEKWKISDGGERYKLELLDCQLDDAGVYKVVVSNVLGGASENCTLGVISAKEFRLPQILVPLGDTKVPKPDTANLQIVLTADPIPVVKWEHDGNELDPEFVLNSDIKKIHHGLKECTYTLTIPSTKHFDTGMYSFKAENKSGEAESSARLDIILKPEIQLFKDVTIIPYEDGLFTSVIHSNPKATITWKKDGKKIETSDHMIIENDSVNEIFKLYLKNVHLEDEGTYTISAVNSVGEASADAKLHIHMEEPLFTKGIENISVREYSRLDLKVRAEGVPKPEITWSKDGVDIELSEGMTLDTRSEGQVSSHLVIPHFKESDAGKYKVKAYNVAGQAETVCDVTLTLLAPMFSKALNRAEDVGEGDPFELKCKVEASPLATVKWLKDGEDLKESENIKMINLPDGSIKLRIEKISPADCGAYKVIVENSQGSESAICAVAVIPNARRPNFIKELEDVSLTEGEPLLLEAQIMAFPLPEIKWFKDGLPVRQSRAVNFINSPGGIIGLSIEKVSPEHQGSYTVSVTNKLGDASSDSKVTVNLKDRKPEFRFYLCPTVAVEGFPVKLSIKIEGTPRPTIAWMQNGSPVEIDGEHIKILESEDGVISLVIDKATQLDSGMYSVTATNAAGSISTQAKLDVTSQVREDMPEQAPAFAQPLRDSWAEEGSLLNFSIPFLGNPIPDITWTKDEVEIKPDHRITFLNDGYKIGLQINPTVMKDKGVYCCKLVNKLGHAETYANGTIKKIFHAPVFTHKLRDLEQVIGLDGKLSCSVTGNPRPDVVWFKHDLPITDSAKYRLKRDGDNCLLYIKECGPDDDGYFKCVATNRDGKDECEALFRAVDKISKQEKGEAPCFLKKLGDQEVIGGIAGRLTACISGHPSPEVEWFRNNERLFPSERITMEREETGLLRLIISHIDPSVDCAVYKLHIFNIYGEDECEANLIFDTMGLGERRPVGEQYKDFEEFKQTGAPLPLADRPIISRMTDRRLTLSWKPSIPIGPREPVTYQVEMYQLPNGQWFTARSGIRSCTCEIRNLEPFRDYKFRVRVENKYGVSDASPFAITYRAKLEPDPPKFIPYLAPGIDFRPETSPYFPKDFDIERPPHDGYAQAPRFLRQEYYTQYGVKGHNCSLYWFVYGYPKPKMSFFFNDEPIEMGGRYDSSYTRNGQATLFINRMLERDVGTYEAIAANEHGEARQRVHLEIAEYPEFIKRPDETTVISRHTCRLEARVVGAPQPDIKWYKDWQPLAASSRIKIHRMDPDHCVLTITDAIGKDAGLYSISATNVAGTISCSVVVHVEEKDEHPFHMYGRGHNVKAKTKPLTDHYDLGEELGRGTQGITYHAVERVTGRNYAAKIMHGRGELKAFMNNEMEIMNQLNHHKLIKIHDAFETLDSIVLIIELGSGGELLDCLTRQPYTSESEIASIIRQLLVGLDHMHDQNIAHLGLTVGDLLIAYPGGDDVKLCDYGLARRIHPGQLEPLDFGMPEFVSPETIKGFGVDLSSDMWSVGIITHLLLTGVSIFRGINDMETLDKIRNGFWEFDDKLWKNLSIDAKDFITKLLVSEPNERMSVKAALGHPWLHLADRLPPNMHQISTENLHNYYNLWKDWYSNASCRTWYRRRPLQGAYSHPSHMVYPQNYCATPSQSPEREIKDKNKPSWVDQLPSRQPLHYDMELMSSESHYQNGPDTYLLQLRDVDFPVRIREYMKVAATRGTGFRSSEDNHLDWKLPVIRERRRFTDVMDEEIDDERKNRISQYGVGDSYTVRRLKHEIGTRLDTHVEAEALIEATRQGQAPFLREKPQITPIEEDKPAQLVCYAVGEPKPIIQWFKNDMMLGNTTRVKITEDETGRSILSFTPASAVDAGIYKVVARNRVGQTICRTRVMLAQVPDAPDSPQESGVSDTQVLLRWKQPKHDGNSPVICYSIQYKSIDDAEWKDVNSNVTHEFYLVRCLRPTTGYIFRLSARNSIGWSQKGIPTDVIRTLDDGCPPVEMTPVMKHLQSVSEQSNQQEIVEEPKELLDYSVEKNPVEWGKHLPTEKYRFVSEIFRGRFSVAVKAIDKTCDKVVVAKLLEYSTATEEKVNAEFEALRTLRHERIASLFEAYKPLDSAYCALILEKLQGADVLTYLSSRHEYTEQMVATIITQVLDGLQYLHWRGYCHLDVQPDNVVIASVRSVQIKLVDMGCAQKVSKLGNVVKHQSSVEYSAPEVLCLEPAYPQSDVWSVGVLTYVLLSGASPFRGDNPAETRQNINFVRFRFEYLYKELTQEATRFLMLVFKRAPNKRPSAEECHEHRWLLPTDYMVKRRERAVFLGNRLKDYCESYHKAREDEASSLEALTCLVPGKGPLARSNSIVDELTTHD